MTGPLVHTLLGHRIMLTRTEDTDRNVSRDCLSLQTPRLEYNLPHHDARAEKWADLGGENSH